MGKYDIVIFKTKHAITCYWLKRNSVTWKIRPNLAKSYLTSQSKELIIDPSQHRDQINFLPKKL